MWEATQPRPVFSKTIFQRLTGWASPNIGKALRRKTIDRGEAFAEQGSILNVLWGLPFKEKNVFGKNEKPVALLARDFR